MAKHKNGNGKRPVWLTPELKEKLDHLASGKNVTLQHLIEVLADQKPSEGPCAAVRNCPECSTPLAVVGTDVREVVRVVQ